MATIPEPVAELLDAALVGELTVVDGDGRPVTYPLIPLWDGEQVYLTSSTLFSRKLEHIRANPKVSLSITDPVAVGGATDRATIQGDARVIEEDPHGGWERLLPIWETKEPSIVYFLKARVALPLFFERALIEITPRRVLYWSDGDTATAPAVDRPSARRPRDAHAHPELDARDRASRSSRPIPTRSPPGSTTTATRSASPSRPRSTRRPAPRRSRRRPAWPSRPIGDVSLTGSHIRPQPGYGYDERRHVTVWGAADASDGGRALTLPADGVGLGRGRGPVLRVLGAVRRQVAALLRRAVGRARDAGQAAAVVRVPDPADDPAAVPDRDDRAGRARHPDRRAPRLVRPASRRC